MKKLNVGSGQDVRPSEEGWINLDTHNKLGAQCIFNLDDIYKGKKIPFEDNTFDVVYCSHVLEDFIKPLPIINELVRVCKTGGIIEIKVPYMTCVWDGIYHQRPYSISQFFMYTATGDYNENERPVRVKKINFYTPPLKLHNILWDPIITPTTFLLSKLFNLLIKIKYNFVDHSIIRHLANGQLYIEMKYEKISLPRVQESLLERIKYRLKR